MSTLNPLYKQNAIIWDPESSSQCKVEGVKILIIRGVRRIFYRLAVGGNARPEEAWREEHEILPRAPRPEDYDV